MRKALFCAILFTVAMFLASALPVVATPAPFYFWKDLGTLPAPYNAGSYAYAVNNTGQVVGYSFDLSGNQHAFLYRGGVMQDLGTLSNYSAGSQALAINAAGQVVGYSFDLSRPAINGTQHAFLYTGSAMVDLGTLPILYHVNSKAVAINDSGQVVGNSFGPDPSAPIDYVFLYSSVVMLDLGTLGGNYSDATGINNSGQVVGYGHNSSGFERAFIYNISSGVWQDLGMPPNGSKVGHSGAMAINAGGQVAGYATISSGADHAFLYSSGAWTDLGTLGGYESRANAINRAGQIAGWAYTSAAQHAMLYSGGVMWDLNNLVANLNLPTGNYLKGANGINDRGQIVANSTNGHAYLLTPRQAPVADLQLLLLN